MFLKKNIWLIFYILLFIGSIYLASSIYSSWNNIQTKTAEELSYLNKIFSSSVTSTFDQQEIMLELLGQQLTNKNLSVDVKEKTNILDKLVNQNSSLIGMGLSNVDGQLIEASSNVNLKKMPNLKQNSNSRESFLRTLDSQRMVLGKTYFLGALNSWVIPIRKAIRDEEHNLAGVMTAGIKPKELLPSLNHLNRQQKNIPYQSMIIHDNSYLYAYISGISNTDSIKNILNQPVSSKVIGQHQQSLKQQLGLSMSDLKNNLNSAEYIAQGEDGKNKMYSLSYIPDYQLWSLTYIPQKLLVNQLITSTIQYVLIFTLVFSIIFILFRYINGAEQVKRQQLINQANHDFLTGLSNRLYLKYVEPEWVNDNAEPFSVLFMDLDNFKNINDSYGHNYGDMILKQVASRLLLLFTEKSLVCRQGGDEFIILCRKTDQQDLNQVASKVLQRISQPYKIENYKFTIGASIGICRYPADGDNFDSLFSAADTAMYRAKGTKNNYFIFTNELKEQIYFTSQIEQALHTALRQHEFHMVYQPQIASKGALYGVESLIRWNNPELGFIPPNKFIPIAEDSGFILELGHFIIDQSIQDIARLSNTNDNYDLQLSINISVRQFLEFGFLDRLKTSLVTHKLPSKQLTLEITESIFIDDFEYMLPLFQEIRALGIKISLDDFGTGFSSLSMLKKLPIDELKIDKSFIDHIVDNRQDRSMVINILNIAKNLGLKTVAEGIESQEQAELLSDIDCDIQQGYFYSRGIEYSELEQYCSSYMSPLKSPSDYIKPDSQQPESSGAQTPY